jgi:Putative Flp pilus-assembly TadE/G-like
MKPKLLMERGQALILIALAAVGLFAITGLAIDGGAKFSDRRHAQNAADTAALTAALTKATGLTNGETDSVCSTASGWTNSTFCLDIINAAWDRAEENGYDGLIPDSVDVYSPPSSGPYLNNSSYVQVIITSYIDTYFARVIGINQTKNTVEAVALTKEGGPIFNGASVVSTNPHPNCSSGGGSGGGSVDVSGSGTINLNGGGIFVNSNESCGFSQPNCTGATLNIYSGGISSAGSAINTCNSAIPQDTTQNQVDVPDEIYMPAVPDECSQTHALPTNSPIGSNTWIIYPGYYTDFPQGGLIANNKDIILSPGVYCVNGDIHWSGATFNSLDGTSGVTIYITSGHNFSTSINSPIWLNASNSGEYKNYLLIIDGNMNSIQNCTINGGSYLDLNGAIFAPYCNVTINGDNSSNSEFNAQVIGWDIKLNGNNVITFHYNPDALITSKRRVGLMR